MQLEEIDRLKNESKQDPKKVLIVMDHKQKILQMKYREGQVEYYGKKGMSMLGTMIVQWLTKTIKVKEDGVEVQKEVGVFQYKFVDYISKGMLVRIILKLLLRSRKSLNRYTSNAPR